ncbi:hypothetical protein F5883DRAFT_547581 [Diaporthe sp. PMI_573]|nr:hypothetical protein F5883DRAFT_547581 [Diaporthaceae sp. PMI_573]
MAAAFTFGSLGDILAICQIGVSLGKAISDKRGSAKDYQEFRNDVDSLVQVLMQVAATYEASPFMADLARTTKSIVDECGTIMQEELSRLHGKYHDSLQPGGSGSKTRDTYKKVEFSVTERGKLQEAREKLKTRTQQLSTLAAIAAQRTSQADAARVISRLKGIDDTLAESAQRQEEQLQAQNMQSIAACRHMARHRILNGLAFNEMSTRFDEIATAHTDTFKWILDDKFHSRGGISFKRWLSAGRGIFHIAGKPGSGKSTLMKFLCSNSRTQEILNIWAGGKVLIFAKFFFWKPGRTMQKSQGGLLRSILHQCLSNRPELIPLVFPKLWKEAESLDWRVSAAITFTNDDVNSAFKELMQNGGLLSNHRLCFFIDGLDEYEESEKDFQDLITLLQQWTEAASENLKICVSSRELNAFEIGFSPEKRYRLQELTRSDMAQVIRGRLHLHQFGIAHADAQMDQLIQQILSKAQGVFLWVTLVLRTVRESLLNGDSLDMIQRKIDRLPEELEQLFQRIVDSIDVADRKITAQTLEIVAFPERFADAVAGFPWFYNLSWYYYLDNYNEDPNFAMSMISANPGIGKEGFKYQQNGARRRLYGRCKGLVQVFTAREQFPGYDQYITATHRSVYEFLTTPGFNQKLGCHINGFDVTNQLGQSFLAQIKSLDLQQLSAGADKRRLYMFLSAGLHTILTYAHATCASSEEYSKLLNAIEEVLRQRLKGDYQDFFSNHANLIPLASNGSRLLVRPIIREFELSMCHLAAYHGLYHYVLEKIERDEACLADRSAGIGLLHCAIRGMHHVQSATSLETVRAILDLGVSPNGLLYGISSHLHNCSVSVWIHFFSYAVGSLHDSTTQLLVDLLLRYGADADLRFGVYRGGGGQGDGLWVEYRTGDLGSCGPKPAYTRADLGESQLLNKTFYREYSHPRDFRLPSTLFNFLSRQAENGTSLRDLVERYWTRRDQTLAIIDRNLKDRPQISHP